MHAIDSTVVAEVVVIACVETVVACDVLVVIKLHVFPSRSSSNPS